MPTTENGVEITVLRNSSGDRVEAGDRLLMGYSGSLIGPNSLGGEGPVFDGNYSFEHTYGLTRDVFTFTLGQNQVIDGWEEGLLNRRVGEVLELRIPAELAYGETGSGSLIPPDSDLKFIVFIAGYVPTGTATTELYSLRDYGIGNNSLGDYRADVATFAGREKIGYNGKDVIEGDEYANAIFGLKGKDVLTGHGSGDFLHGGAKRDRFVFTEWTDSTAADPDVILDMTRTDRIDLRQLNSDLAADGFGIFDFDGGANRLTGDAGQLIYSKRRDQLEGDIDGDGRADFVVEMQLKGGLNDLTETQFLL